MPLKFMCTFRNHFFKSVAFSGQAGMLFHFFLFLTYIMNFTILNLSDRKEDSMRPIDVGCTEKSAVYFYTASETAKQTFFYPLCVGHYFCTKDYLVQRNNYDSFLLIYIKKGEGFLKVENRETTFRKEDVVLVDCYKPHVYGTTKDSEILWFHFAGSTSREYVNMIFRNSGPICSVRNLITFEKDLNRILLMISSGSVVNDALCSYYIVKILTDLVLSSSKTLKSDNTRSVTADVISYINDHICEQLTLQTLADKAGLSPFYFTRLFKKETGYTPHEYIILSRINIAKFFLKSTAYSIKEICFSSGFSSESSFCTTFRKICGMTPSEYRENNNLS